MGIRHYNPTTPGRRGATVSDFAELTPGAKPPKHLLVAGHRSSGRNNQGYITARHRGGGHKRKYRLIDFRRNKDGIPALVNSIQYDPNRTARIALLHYKDGEKRYILSRRGAPGGPDPVERFGVGAGGGQLPAADRDSPGHDDPQHRDAARPRRRALPLGRRQAVSAARDADWAQINLPSGEIRRVPAACRATIGAISNAEHMNIVIGKAGCNRWLGWSPACPRHGHEPHRPPARRRRRPHQGRPSPRQPHRRAGQGRPHSQAPQAVQPGHRPPPAVAALRAVEIAEQVDLRFQI